VRIAQRLSCQRISLQVLSPRRPVSASPGAQHEPRRRPLAPAERERADHEERAEIRRRLAEYFIEVSTGSLF
jgi:hypothetical protein